MRRITKLSLVALAGAAVGAVLARLRRSPGPAPPAPPDERADELRRKLAEARAAAADQNDFAAAGMGAETIVEEPPQAEPKVTSAEPRPRPEAAAPPEPPAPAAGSGEAPPQDEFEAMRRRIHEEGKAAAEEMRRSAEPEQPDKPDGP